MGKLPAQQSGWPSPPPPPTAASLHAQPPFAQPSITQLLGSYKAKAQLQAGEEHGQHQDGLIAAVRTTDVEAGLPSTAPKQDAAAPAVPQPSRWKGLRWVAGVAWNCLLPFGARRTSSSVEEQLRPSSSAPFLPGSGLASRRQLARMRWQLAIGAVLETCALHRAMDVLLDRLAQPAARLAAAIDLERRLTGHPARGCVLQALLQRQESRLASFKSHMLQELYITGEQVIQFLTPPPRGHHRLYFTWAMVAVCTAAWLFMAGQYAAFQALSSGPALACMVGQQAGGSPPWGPATLGRWISPRAEGWCFGGAAGSLSADFLIIWGARWAPLMRAEPVRWVSSALLHQSFFHLLSNSALLLALGHQLEGKHGSWRTAALAALAALAGNLFSAVLEPACTAVAGASGAIFGLAGGLFADMALSWASLRRPVMRAALLLAFLVFFLATVATTPSGTSHFSHLGGLLAGFSGGVVLLPAAALRRERWQLALSAACALGVVAIFTSLPLVFYLHVLPATCCGAGC